MNICDTGTAVNREVEVTVNIPKMCHVVPGDLAYATQGTDEPAMPVGEDFCTIYKWRNTGGIGFRSAGTAARGQKALMEFVPFGHVILKKYTNTVKLTNVSSRTQRALIFEEINGM